MITDDQLRCGKIIVFNSILFKNRKAFCIDLNINEQIVYRGLFGLKTINKKGFLYFARIVETFDYYDRELSNREKNHLKTAHLAGAMKQSKTVDEYINKLFMLSKISGVLVYKDESHV